MAGRPTKREPSKPKSSKKLLSNPVPISTIDQLKAIAHPIRQQLLEQFAVKQTTTKQIATKLGLQPTRLYHHVAKLENAGLIELVETRQVRGTTEKYYAAVANSLKIDHELFADNPAKIANEIAAIGIVESLLSNVRNELAEYLMQRDGTPEHDTGDDREKNEILLAKTEIHVRESSVHLFREKLDKLIEEFGELDESEANDSEPVRKYRFVVGWYPLSPS